jgi:monofunctional biosynthetic peptidoglycan transglycosylase
VRRRWARRLLLVLIAPFVAGLLCVMALRWLPPPTSAFMIAARVQALQSGDSRYHTRYQWVPLEQISGHAAIAVIAAEDQQFPFHTGFDFRSIREAVRRNSEGQRVRGASTISQQVAKNLLLWSGGGYFRKGLEAGATLLIEWLWPKERILEMYLNIAQFGHGVYGVEAAAQQFFHRPARGLNREQSALLAAVLPNPEHFRVEAPSVYVSSRQAWILQQMSGLGGTHYLDQLDRAQEIQNRRLNSSATERGGSTKP